MVLDGFFVYLLVFGKAFKMRKFGKVRRRRKNPFFVKDRFDRRFNGLLDQAKIFVRMQSGVRHGLIVHSDFHGTERGSRFLLKPASELVLAINVPAFARASVLKISSADSLPQSADFHRFR